MQDAAAYVIVHQGAEVGPRLFLLALMTTDILNIILGVSWGSIEGVPLLLVHQCYPASAPVQDHTLQPRVIGAGNYRE